MKCAIDYDFFLIAIDLIISMTLLELKVKKLSHAINTQSIDNLIRLNYNN